MADIVGYKEWLTKIQHEPAFINNNWCAMLVHDMEENKDSDGFKIPHFIVEEELIKEDNNVNLKSGWNISNALRHWLVYLLKAHNLETSVFNYEQVLRDFLATSNVLPLGISNPITPTTSFHCLPTECKLWILYTLRNYSKNSHNPKPAGKDPLGNSYYILPNCRLYVRIEGTEKPSLPIDDGRLNNEAWGSLYRFVNSQPCKLLCEDKDGWEVVSDAFQLFKLYNLHYAIRPEFEVKLSGKNLAHVMRDKQRKEFEGILCRLAPVPKARSTKLQVEMIIPETIDGHGPLTAVESGFQIMEITGCDPSTAPIQTKPSTKTRSREMLGKCWNFPQCPLQFKCKYVHPRLPCTKFPNCPRGWECLFLHDICPNDDQCEEPNCSFEHLKSMPTYYRIPREPEESQRPVASVVPTKRVADPAMNNATEAPSSNPSTVKEIGPPQEKRKRCQMFPQCKHGKSCRFFHPTQNCNKLAAGAKCNVKKCLFMHGPCPKDGNCTDFKCTYEHYKSQPVFVRILATKKVNSPGTPMVDSSMNASLETKTTKKNKGSMSRSNSIGNLSMCSVRSSGRKKSVTFDIDSDEESVKDSGKESTEQRPVGILRPSGATSIGRCKYGTRCTNKICEFTHPREKCPAFPECPNGGACIFLHDTCKNDGVCSNENCDFEHYLPHEIDNTWCMYGSRCRKVDCTFLHPQSCIGRCPTPNNCWKYHTPTARQNIPPLLPSQSGPWNQQRYTQTNGPGPGFGPSFGIPGAPGAMPPFGPPPGTRYGYGPDFGYRPNPNFPPAPGYAPGMGYGGYGHHPGFPTGPGYGPGPGMGFEGFPLQRPGNTGPNPGYRSTGSFRPTTPGPSPDSPEVMRRNNGIDSNGNSEDESVDGTERIESTRL